VTANGDPFLPGPTFAAPYHLSGDPAESKYTYGRFDNPTWRAYEQAVGELEGGEAAVFGSGMGAVATLLMALLDAGDRIVIPASSTSARWPRHPTRRSWSTTRSRRRSASARSSSVPTT